MVIEEKDFRETLQRALKGILVIVALMILKGVVGFLLRVDDRFGGLTPGAWIEVVFSLVIVGFAIKLYQPVKTIVTFYLAALVKVGKLPGRDKYLGNLVAAAGNLTLLVFVLSIYAYILPTILQCNEAFLHFRALMTLLNIMILLGAIGILFMLWKNAQPLIDLLTGHITDKVSNFSSGKASAKCPSCKAKNDQEAAFCIICGTPLR